MAFKCIQCTENNYELTFDPFGVKLINSPKTKLFDVMK